MSGRKVGVDQLPFAGGSHRQRAHARQRSTDRLPRTLLRSIDLYTWPHLRLVGKPVKANSKEVAANTHRHRDARRRKTKRKGRIACFASIASLVATVVCALSVVTSQHKARDRLFQALESEQERADQLDIEFDQLSTIQLSTWATSRGSRRSPVKTPRCTEPAKVIVVSAGEAAR